MLHKHPFQTNEKGHLEIGGVDSIELAKKYGTPLYVYDVGIIRKNARAFVETFERIGAKAQVAYASKAFSAIAMVEVAKQEKLSLDVVSEGELYTALQAGFPASKIHLHGNNKSRAELQMAIDHEIGCIVVDNFYDIELIGEILKREGKKMDVLMRVTPGIESKTHKYIMTGNEDSKFGFNLANGQADQGFEMLHNHKNIQFKGIHCHIGSQIFETDRFVVAVDALFKQIQKWKEAHGFIPAVLNLGGGFGIRYTANDEPLPYEHYVESIYAEVKKKSEALDIPVPEIWIEPGRSIVGNAAITLYTIGSFKDIPGIREYVSIDGGMSDNLRPALYEAKYEAVIADRPEAKIEKTVSIAGKCCESGDMLIWDLPVPEIKSDDILAVFATGAYGYSMANNYNRLGRPAVVFAESGTEKLVINRETYKDVVKNDLSYLS